MNGTEAILTVKRFTSPRSPALQADALTSEPPGKPIYIKIGPTKKFFAKKKKKSVYIFRFLRSPMCYK